MGWKCVPQVKGLVRGEPKPNAKHRANGGKILAEMGSERFSRSDTLDRTRSHLNTYTNFSAGLDCWEAMQAEADNYKTKGKTKDGKTFEKSLRADAVIGWSAIINPPAAMTVGWPQERYLAFYRDSWDVLAVIRPEIFRAENVRMSATHRDEGALGPDGEYSEHQHRAGVSRDADGRYCGNLIDAKLVVTINKEYPRMMREKGWDLVDLDITDFERMGKNPDGTYKDPEYRASRLARKKGGKSVNKYIADKAREVEQVYTEAIDQAQQMAATAQAVIDEAEEREQIVSERIARQGKGLFGLRKESWIEDLARKEQELDRKATQQAQEHAEAMQKVSDHEQALKRRDASLRAKERRLDERAENLTAEVEQRAKELAKPTIAKANATAKELAKLIGKAETVKRMRDIERAMNTPTTTQRSHDENNGPSFT